MFYNIILFFLVSKMWIIEDCNDMEKLRMAYHEIDSKIELLAFIKSFENSNCPLSVPYLASAFMQQAEYTLLPYQKLKYFKEGKRKLEAYIENYPNDLEGRYVRFLVQSNLPAFLGYTSDLEGDNEFIRRNLDATSLSVKYKEVILLTMNKLEAE